MHHRCHCATWPAYDPTMQPCWPKPANPCSEAQSFCYCSASPLYPFPRSYAAAQQLLQSKRASVRNPVMLICAHVQPPYTAMLPWVPNPCNSVFFVLWRCLTQETLPLRFHTPARALHSILHWCTHSDTRFDVLGHATSRRNRCCSVCIPFPLHSCMHPGLLYSSTQARQAAAPQFSALTRFWPPHTLTA